VTVQSVLPVIYPTHSDRTVFSSVDKTPQVTANLDKPSGTYNYTNCEANHQSDFLDKMTLVDLCYWSNQLVFYFL